MTKLQAWVVEERILPATQALASRARLSLGARTTEPVPRKLPDGTVIWTSPSGRTYTTTPGGSLFFPVLASPTGELKVPKGGVAAVKGRGLMMPRRRTRAQDRDDRISAECRINDQILKRHRWLFEELEKRREELAANDPPPFLSGYRLPTLGLRRPIQPRCHK